MTWRLKLYSLIYINYIATIGQLTTCSLLDSDHVQLPTAVCRTALLLLTYGRVVAVIPQLGGIAVVWFVSEIPQT